MRALSKSANNYNGECKVTSPLRQQMIDDMNLAGLSPMTQKRYLEAVIRIQRATGVRPDHLTESELRKYLIGMRDVDKVARGTFQVNFFGLKFFYYRVLDCNWGIFVKKRSHFHVKSDCLSHYLWMTAVA